jgi:hypothetical protein
MAEVARRMGAAGRPVNQTAIWKIENGAPRRTISLDETLALAEVFGLTVADLLRSPEQVVTADVERDLEQVRNLYSDARACLDRLHQGIGGLSDMSHVPRLMLDYAGLTEVPSQVEDLRTELEDLSELLLEMAGELAGERHMLIVGGGRVVMVDGDSDEDDHGEH